MPEEGPRPGRRYRHPVPFHAGREHQRGVAVNTVTPAWDGKEIWLVLGGGGLVA